MKKFVFIRLMAGMMLLMLASAGFAQEELTPEQQELVERVVAVAEAEHEFDSFVETRATVEDQTVVVTLGEVTQELTQSETLEAVATIILGDAPNGSATGTLSVASNDGAQELAYVISFELRYVDEVLYVNAAYDESTENAPVLPEGWVEVADPAAFPEFEKLDLQGFLDYFADDEEEDESNDPLDNLALIVENVTDVASEEEEFEGEPVETIYLTLGWDGLQTILSESGNFNADDPMLGLFEAAFAGQEDPLTIAVTLDEEEMPLAFSYAFTLNAEDLDMALVDPSLPEGAQLDLMLDNSAMKMRTQVNETFEPVEAPE